MADRNSMAWCRARLLALQAVKTSYSQRELDEVLAGSQPRLGWDFSRMRASRAPVPWEYAEVVGRYLRPADEVLDVGTGDGARFADLAGKFGGGLGVDPDPDMIRLAAQAYPTPVLEFRIGDARLTGIAASFDVIINRHASLDLAAIAARLKPGGYFVTQQVGERNMTSVKEALRTPPGAPPISAAAVTAAGLRLIAFCEYDVKYIVHDIDSLVYWFGALDLPHADLAGADALASADVLNAVLAGNVGADGFVTNEHRYLVVAGARR